MLTVRLKSINNICESNNNQQFLKRRKIMITQKKETSEIKKRTILIHPILRFYGCDEFNNIYSFVNKMKIIKPQLYNNGYYFFRPRGEEEGTQINKSVHQFVYECFHGMVPNYGRGKDDYSIHHIDGDKHNNVPSNLQLVKTGQHHSEQDYKKGCSRGIKIMGKSKDSVLVFDTIREAKRQGFWGVRDYLGTRKKYRGYTWKIVKGGK